VQPWQPELRRIDEESEIIIFERGEYLGNLNIPHIDSVTHSSSHAGYYPGAVPMSIKISFSPDNGRLLGAQIVGFKGVDKRIDIFS